MRTIAAAKANDSAICGMQLLLQLGKELCIIGHGLLRRQELHVLLQRFLEGLGHSIVSVLCKYYEGPKCWGIFPDEACGIEVPACVDLQVPGSQDTMKVPRASHTASQDTVRVRAD